MVLELRRAHLFGQQRAGAAVGAVIAFLDDDLPFGVDVILHKPQVLHPVGFHFHDQGQPVGSDALEIGGIVPRGERVVVAALRLDDGRELVRPDAVGALEHQVFQEMRDARLAGGLVRGAHAVPQHLHRDRRPGVLDHHDL